MYAVMTGKTPHSLPYDPDTGKQQQRSLYKGGEIFYLAVSVLMLRVGGLVGNSNGEKREQRGDQIEPGVRRLRKNTETAGTDSDHYLQPGNYHCRQHGTARSGALFGAAPE